MKKSILLLIALILFSGEIIAETYPITPAPLRKLINESEVIIIGTVKHNKPYKSKDSWTSDVAYVSIREVLQGKVMDSIIEVFYSSNMICPSPASYPKEAKVIAFLDKNKGGYTTHALSYGSKVLDEEGISVYKSRILEMQKINMIKNETEKRLKTVDWLVECIKNKVTRWEGTYELSPQSDFMSFYDRSDKENTIRLILNSRQRHELRNVLFNEKEFNYHDIGLVDLVIKGPNDNEIKDLLVKSLKSEKDNVWYAEFIMERIVFLDERKELKLIIDKLENEYDFNDFEKENARKNRLIKEFIDKI